MPSRRNVRLRMFSIAASRLPMVISVHFASLPLVPDVKIHAQACSGERAGKTSLGAGASKLAGIRYLSCCSNVCSTVT
jgi:hypothetical protein